MNRKNKQPKKLAVHGDTVKTLSAPELASVDGGLLPTMPTTSFRSQASSCWHTC